MVGCCVTRNGAVNIAGQICFKYHLIIKLYNLSNLKKITPIYQTRSRYSNPPFISARDRLIERWKDTEIYFNQQDVKRVNYLSLEFLLGRSLQNAMSNLNLEENFSRALKNLGVKMEELVDQVCIDIY
jgi:glucan phosphorylase